jgi:hypothetical protein
MKSITSSLKNKIGISFCAALGLAGHSLMPLHVKAQSTTRWPNTVNVSYGSKSYTLNAVGNITFQDFTNQGLFTALIHPGRNLLLIHLLLYSIQKHSQIFG